MMTDIVIRLRQRLGDAWKLNDEAADEIERLRAALEWIDEYHNAGGTQLITCARIAKEALKEESK
jgi:hypothetical protein